MKTKQDLRNSPIRFAGFPKTGKPQQASAPLSAPLVEDQDNLFSFTFNSGEGATLVYQSAFRVMVDRQIEVKAEDHLIATAYYGNQMTADQARSENSGLHRGLMTACACASIVVRWVSAERYTEEVTVEVRYAKLDD